MEVCRLPAESTVLAYKLEPKESVLLGPRQDVNVSNLKSASHLA